MPDLSVPANAFAIVGLADVVLRLSIEAAELYSRYSNASQTVNRLIRDLGNLVDIVTHVRAFTADYNNSPFVVDDSQSLVPQLENTLRDCEGELQDLKRIAESARRNTTDGWFQHVKKGFSWAIDEKTVLQSCQQIEKYKATLNTTLSLTGRQNDLIFRREIKATRDDISSAQATSATLLRQVGQQITTTSQNNSDGFQQISSAIHTFSQSSTTNIEHLKKSIGTVKTNIDGLDRSLQAQSSTLHEGFSGVNEGLDCTKNALLTQQQSSSSRLENKMDGLSALTQQIATFRLLQTEDNDFIFQGDRLESVVWPLMLFQEDLTKAVCTLITQRSSKLSKADGQWIGEEFEKLIVRGHQAAAVAGKRRIARLPPCHTVSKSDAQIIDGSRGLGVGADVARSYKRPLKLGSAKRSTKHHWFDTAFGSIFLNEISQTIPGGSSSLNLCVSFIPKIHFHSVAMTVSLDKVYGTCMAPQISRIIHTCNMIPGSSKAFTCIENNDIKGLEELFSNGEASPNDCNQYGLTLIMWAAGYGTLEVYDWLLSQGADITLGFWFMTQSAIEQGCDPEDILRGLGGRSVLHEFVQCFDERKDCSDEDAFNITHKIIGWGCDIDACDFDGKTPLLLAGWLGKGQLFQILVRMGANIKATNNDGCGALHLLLYEFRRGNTSQQQADFRDALITALRHGCCPTMPDNDGYTPFDAICYRSAWLVWKEVLQETKYVLVDDNFDAMPVLVSTNEAEVETRAPISWHSIERWREKAKPWREEYWCQVEKRWKLEWEAEYAELARRKNREMRIYLRKVGRRVQRIQENRPRGRFRKQTSPAVRTMHRYYYWDSPLYGLNNKGVPHDWDSTKYLRECEDVDE
ncbi:hypothetical protein HYFRA_00001480 [Hymenoscyphus fraxineus]|uniref:Fungal N-terminal domain-containing protein n=1 Tax=Hymenoscyphus fraxineus TaxID=746836 RepID=A0A9N9L7R4_9HELO|nr:hypothetical protein HYFRA_00001480 [Hymenoscyphus fraxineus]